ncbi:YggS family pyridoxal phosphate-dependent enzyme [Actinosynnema mirum]|uniref:Pyridoxal phosphate homeostasis protein n=1 Tax=Actinosynnema mirum (strain ATCC 29888 / DSM 43827 / JCM 3225 / NBRC 14064 / NCIMB 13271 / NRRL B-12336 / IMRU 3971 / 101) TaxID=446462 RepID=C6WDD4_ACTMD|nr:YggS family pyridoxal phosphate-dependent enzyme [Actinosynnema mirum]ACU39571.1 alanine racemase domain protein [Actinosynnema mirum DSM 43827]
MSREEELRLNLAEVRARIAKACETADRDPAEVTLLAVTKTFPASDVRLLHGLGLRDFAENKDQEARAKVAELGDLDANWRMVGRLQRNKARSVLTWADRIDSVDSARLVDALVEAAAKNGVHLDVLIQVSIDGDAARGGCPVPDLPDLAARIGRSSELRLRGVMAVAPLGRYPGEAFALLKGAVTRLRDDHPDATVISAGMSGDLEDAIAWGSTCVRVGTALLGSRGLTSP